MSKREATRKGIAFWLTLTTSIGLIVAGFVVPPTGIIDGSVLKAVGLLLGFATIAQIPVIIEVAGYFRMTKGDLVIETSKEDRSHPLHHREDIVEQDDKAAGDEGID
jgi:hypothetical protein